MEVGSGVRPTIHHDFLGYPCTKKILYRNIRSLSTQPNTRHIRNECRSLLATADRAARLNFAVTERTERMPTGHRDYLPPFRAHRTRRTRCVIEEVAHRPCQGVQVVIAESCRHCLCTTQEGPYRCRRHRSRAAREGITRCTGWGAACFIIMSLVMSLTVPEGSNCRRPTPYPVSTALSQIFSCESTLHGLMRTHFRCDDTDRETPVFVYNRRERMLHTRLLRSRRDTKPWTT